MEPYNAPYCDTHKLQMPVFLTFKALGSMQQDAVLQCATNKEHALANKYCPQCKKALCSTCAFDHAVHGAIDIQAMQQRMSTLLNEKMDFLQLQMEYASTVRMHAKDVLKQVQQVQILIVANSKHSITCKNGYWQNCFFSNYMLR